MNTLTKKLLSIAAALLTAGAAQAGGTYPFMVFCPNDPYAQPPNRTRIVVWKTGDLDPGRGYLWAKTAHNNLNCSVGDYHPSYAGLYPVQYLSHEQAVIDGYPGIMPPQCSGCR